MSYKKLTQDDTVCIGDCLNCDYFIFRQYDVCSPENSTCYLDIYESIWEAEKETKRTLLRQYENSIGVLTPEERKELHDWVAVDNSPYENPWGYADEDCRPLGFIETIRLIDDMTNNPKDYSF
jgi:hypothetical protein